MAIARPFSTTKTKYVCMILVFIFMILLAETHIVAEGRALFVFGDSLVDAGNNNYIGSCARADSLPYGLDYPTHTPTGRFSNGYNIADILSQQIGGQESPLPYLSPEINQEKERLIAGANFASAGVGILDDTGLQFESIIKMPQQLQYFSEYQRRLCKHVGAQRARDIVSQALVLVTVGGNDFVNNYYFTPNSTRFQQYNLPNYVCLLINEYKKILMRLYKLGARRVVVTGTGPLGCVPAELAQRSKNGECAAELQRAASLFNPQLIQMLQGLNRKIGSTVFVVANTHQVHTDFITDPQAYGFVTSKVACCGQGAYNGVGLCTSSSNLCLNRDQYAFWDAFHPSEKANRIIVQQMMTGSTEYMMPMNISTVLYMDSKP